MSRRLHSWRVGRRFRRTVQELRALSSRELGALGIPASQIERLACEAARH